MIRSLIYDTLILGLTSRWYAEVLRRVPEGGVLLDVGVGTAGALSANADLIRRRHIRVTGIDINPEYLACARRRVRSKRLTDCAEVILESVYSHRGGPYDAVYFSGSLMLLPEPERALRHCTDLLGPDGRIYLTQTLETRPAPWMEYIKPRLKRVTTIDFGPVTYEDTLRSQLHAASLAVEELTVLGGRGSRVSCIAVARPIR